MGSKSSFYLRMRKQPHWWPTNNLLVRKRLGTGLKMDSNTAHQWTSPRETVSSDQYLITTKG